MMNLFKRELRQGLTGFLVWSITLGILIFFTMSIFPSVSSSNIELNQYIKSLPTSMAKALSLNNLNMSDMLSFYNSCIGIYIILCAAIYAMLFGTGIISKEINDKTVEFLQSKPITRSSIITQKLIPRIFYVIALNMLLFLMTYFSFEHVKKSDYSIEKLLLIFIGYTIIEITFVSLGLFLSLIIKNKKISTNLSIWTVFGMYLLYILAGISDKFSYLKCFTPFKYADASDIIADGKLKAVYIIILTIVNMILIGVSYIIYNHKDISV
ncbi:MAG: ABC transporter permease subunit [Bacillota bacterium]|nr:ABC transporter permease subunit [Bacillota bacterium]